MVLKLNDQGGNVELLQRRLTRAGYTVEITHVFDQATETAVMALQRDRGLVVDGQAGPKTEAALHGAKHPKHLSDTDLIQAADALGLPVATVRAVNQVESRGCGFLPNDDRPAILFERHVFYQRLTQRGIDPAPLAAAQPNIVNQARGGYQGGAAEYVRLASAELIDTATADESASWGAFQIMGYHWDRLGYASIDEFVACMESSEAHQLDAFVRFIKADSGLLAALKAKKWAVFAKGYNGPDYAANLYDAKLVQAYAQFSAQHVPSGDATQPVTSEDAAQQVPVENGQADTESAT